jgi:cytochrome c553
MKFDFPALILGALWLVPGGPGLAEEFPAWAYVINPPGLAPPADHGEVVHVPDSTVGFTRGQYTAIDGPVPDWHPEDHIPMPPIVGQGRPPQVYACGYCHLPTGAGRPENSSLAGLTPGYIKQQMLAFRNGDRAGSAPDRLPQTIMIALAQAATDAEIEKAANYFSMLRPVSFVKVVESALVPVTTVDGWTRKLVGGGGTEPIGNRIIEVPDDFERFERRDARTTYTAYVPPGSIQRGSELIATGGGGKTVQCVTCHGPELKGLLDVPRLVGRSPSYLMRQLYDLQHGRRKGGTTELMKPVVANLTTADMVDIVAYLASREP